MVFDVRVGLAVLPLSLSPSLLQGNIDFQLDHDKLEMDQWSHLSEDFELPRRVTFLRKIPVLGK